MLDFESILTVLSYLVIINLLLDKNEKQNVKTICIIREANSTSGHPVALEIFELTENYLLGARGLRAKFLEKLLLDAMFDLPGSEV